ncbi:hypothetical protein THRCLA_09057 [Thraustotheca clavata]|uniref:Protein YIPF n=1 Tax=Thraustotheca clavata TaxID=74557 RepID=A0A1V9YZW9_9STRA|nr:hypothetical protein THRCLA_09057 [Thraustotheca clavata]
MYTQQAPRSNNGFNTGYGGNQGGYSDSQSAYNQGGYVQSDNSFNQGGFGAGSGYNAGQSGSGYGNQGYNANQGGNGYNANQGSNGYGNQGGYNNFNPPNYGNQQANYNNVPSQPNSNGGGSPWFTGGDAQGDMAGTMGRMGDNSTSNQYGGEEDYDNEPPLLEELGVNFNHIWTKTLSVLLPTKQINENILDDTDLAGPLVFCFIFGTCLLLSGKIHFGYIYGFGLFGWAFMWAIMNLLSPTRTIDVYRVCSVLGYCLLPIILLAAINIVISIKGLNYVGFLLAMLSVIWSTHTATRFFEKALHMSDQRFLIAYPTAMVYSCFVLITVF